MSLKARIADAQKQLKVLIKSAEDHEVLISTKSYGEDDAAKDDDQSMLDDFIKQSDELLVRIENMKKMEVIAAKAESSVVKAGSTDTSSPAIVSPVIEKDPSLFIALQAHALYMSGGDRMGAADYAKHSLGNQLLEKSFRMPRDLVTKTAVLPGDSVTTGWAAELIQIQQANQAFIELLRPMSILARFPGRQMAFDGYGSIKIPRQTGGTSGGFLAENAAIPVGALAFDSITLDPKKMGTIVVSSNELLARSTPSALQLIRDDILQGIATAIDTKFVSADAASAGVSPAGIQTFDSSPTVSGGVGDLNEITAELKAMLNQLMSLNMPMTSPVWMLNPTTANGLRFIRDGLGSYAFQAEMNNGTLLGYPFLESTTIPATIVMLADASQVVVASALAPQISISQDTSIHMETAPNADIGGAATPVQSMFQTDSTAIRGLVSLDWNARYDNCVSVLTGVAWA